MDYEYYTIVHDSGCFRALTTAQGASLITAYLIAGGHSTERTTFASLVDLNSQSWTRKDALFYDLAALDECAIMGIGEHAPVVAEALKRLKEISKHAWRCTPRGKA